VKLALDHLSEPLEQVSGIIWARPGFGMMLDRKNGQIDVLHALFGPVIKVPVGKAHLPIEAFDIDAIIMVLRSNLHTARYKVLHRMISSMMAEFEFVCPASHGESQYLVSEADTENRFLAYKFPGILDGISDSLGVARSVAEYNTIGILF
jgi:hypothetical protein